MRQREVKPRSFRHDAGGIDMGMAGIIMALDMIQVHRLADARHLAQVAQIIGKVGIIDNTAQIALKVAVVNRIEAH